MADRTPDISGLTVAPNAPGDLQNPPAAEQELKVHHFWGRYDDVDELPNHPSNPAVSPAFDFMRQGDTAFVQTGADPGDGNYYYLCDRGTLGGGDAIWCLLVTSGGDAPGHGSILTWGNDRIVASPGRRFLHPGYDDQVAEVQPIWVPAPAAGVIRDLTVFFNDPYVPPPPTGDTLNFTLCVFSGAGPPPAFGSAAWPAPGTGPDTTLTLVGVPVTLTGRLQNTTVAIAVPTTALLCVAVDKINSGGGQDVPERIVTTFRWT